MILVGLTNGGLNLGILGKAKDMKNKFRDYLGNGRRNNGTTTTLPNTAPSGIALDKEKTEGDPAVAKADEMREVLFSDQQTFYDANALDDDFGDSSSGHSSKFD